MLQVPLLRPEMFNCLQFGAAAPLESAVLIALGVSAGVCSTDSFGGPMALFGGAGSRLQAADFRQQV